MGREALLDPGPLLRGAFGVLSELKIEGAPTALIVFSGLPGTGKTTISRTLAARIGAVYLRIDTIEQAMKAAGLEIGPTGYAVANALAEANLLLGHSVVADCVNPVRESRVGWRKVAAKTSATLIDIHLICSDVDEHRRRIETRSADIAGHVLPTWEKAIRHEFEAHDGDHLLLDSAAMSIDGLVDRSEAYIAGKRAEQ